VDSIVSNFCPEWIFAISAAQTAKDFLSTNNSIISDIKSKAFSKSLTAIYILQSSLDFEKGGEIAINLYSLYEFCKSGVMKGFTTKNSKLIYDSIPPIEEILDGWKQIAN